VNGKEGHIILGISIWQHIKCFPPGGRTAGNTRGPHGAKYLLPAALARVRFY
jgi:hypothetical protein